MIYRRKQQLPSKWFNIVLRPALVEIKRLCTLETANFSTIGKDTNYPTNEKEADEFIKQRIKIWLTNITGEVEAIEDTILNKF